MAAQRGHDSPGSASPGGYRGKQGGEGDVVTIRDVFGTLIHVMVARANDSFVVHV